MRWTVCECLLVGSRVGPGWALTCPRGAVPRQDRSVVLATLEVRPASDAESATLGESDDIQTDAPDNEIARFPSPSGIQVAILFGTRDVREVKVLKLTKIGRASCRERVCQYV